MLAVFEKSVGKPPEELRLPSMGSENSKTREDILQTFRASWPEASVYNFSNGNFMALARQNDDYSHPRYLNVYHFWLVP